VERANKRSELGERRTTAMVDRVKWKVVLAVGAVAGGTLWYVRRKSRRAAADAELWAEATDPITRFGDA
jgi:hypothetical protein